MFALYFSDLFAVLTTALILAMFALIAVSLSRHRAIDKWGRLILVFILVGTAISAFSATRDAYMGENALFAANGAQSLVCSIAGGLIYLAGLASLLVRKQAFRKASFCVISALFLVQVITIEASRVAMRIGGLL